MKTAQVLALGVGLVVFSVAGAQPPGSAPMAPPVAPFQPIAPPCPTCPPNFTCTEGCEVGPDCYTLHMRGGVEFLYWALKEDRLKYPLLTTSRSGAGDGIITNPDTQVLVHEGDIDHDALRGMRFSWGVYDPRYNFILEADGFWFDDGDEFNRFRSAGLPVLARPFENSEDGTPSAILLAFPDSFSGGADVQAFQRFWGVQAHVGCHLHDNSDWGVDFLVGGKYLRMRENLTISDVAITGANGLGFFNGALTQIGDTRLRQDSFATKNEFYGPQIGVRAEYNCGPCYVMVKGLIAVGEIENRLVVKGTSGLIRNGQLIGLADGGLLALPTNSGAFGSNDVIAVPEAQITMGITLFDHFRLFAGYSFLYWMDIYRPGDQVPFIINPNLVPTSPTFGQGGSANPPPRADRSGFWAHGLHAGVSVRF